eukprot:894345-Pelagomonas_calceolata.AAC.2
MGGSSSRSAGPSRFTAVRERPGRWRPSSCTCKSGPVCVAAVRLLLASSCTDHGWCCVKERASEGAGTLWGWGWEWWGCSEEG